MADMPPEDHRLTPDTLPTPFSAAEIRSACASGRSNSFLVERTGADPYVMRWEFIAADADGAEGERWTETTDGAPLQARERSRSSWTELQAHASYPAATTTISTETVEIPAGRFSCWCYTTETDSEVTRAFFARSLPGPPVLVRTEVAGSVVFRSTLVAFVDPRE